MLESDAQDPNVVPFWNSVTKWFKDLEITNELEPDESRLIAAAIGALTPQDAVNASWRSEGMGVLAWALDRGELPGHDETVEPRQFADPLGFMLPRSETVLASASLRKPDELQAYRDVAFTVHWRLTQFSLDGAGMDFAQFLRTAWFGPLSLGNIRLVDEDLPIGGVTISRAPIDLVRRARSIAAERHQAANWLCGEHAVYSDVGTNT